MKLINQRNCALVLVDYQKKLMPAIHHSDQVISRSILLARIAKKLEIPIIGTEQNPDGLGSNNDVIRNLCDSTLAKMTFDACKDGLLDELKRCNAAPVSDIVISGCEAHVCLLQTAMGLIQGGFAVSVVSPACGSRAEPSHGLAMKRLAQSGANIVDVEMVAFEWLRSSAHPHFKSVLSLLK